MSFPKCVGALVFAMLAPATSSAENAITATEGSDEMTGAHASASADANAPRESPIAAFTYAAQGAEEKSIGVQAYGLGLVAADQKSVLGGGGAIWGSPLKRLTLVVDGQRSLSRDFSPSAAMILHFYGEGDEGLSLGALGKFKIDGFAGGPARDEIESEIELGMLASYRHASWYVDANAIAGQGTGDDGEMDTEARLRFGRALGAHGRLGFDGQVRARVAGPRLLPNGRTWDFAAGPQAMVAWDRWYGSLTAGPATTGLVSRNVGWLAILSVGAVAF